MPKRQPARRLRSSEEAMERAKAHGRDSLSLKVIEVSSKRGMNI